MSNHPSAFDPNDLFGFNKLGVGRTAPSPSAGGFRSMPGSTPFPVEFEGTNFGAVNAARDFPEIDQSRGRPGGGIGDGIGGPGDDDTFNWFGKGGALIPGLKALGGVFDMKTSAATMRAKKRAFEFNQKLSMTNLANQARVTNAQIEDRARSVGRQTGLQGPALEKFIADRVSQRRVSGTV